jgi:hypothetical protein
MKKNNHRPAKGRRIQVKDIGGALEDVRGGQRKTVECPGDCDSLTVTHGSQPKLTIIIIPPL